MYNQIFAYYTYMHIYIYTCMYLYIYIYLCEIENLIELLGVFNHFALNPEMGTANPGCFAAADHLRKSLAVDAAAKTGCYQNLIVA